MLAKIHQHIEKLLDVGHVEVAGHHQVTAAPVVLTQKRMDTLYIVDAMGAVAEVPQPNFT